MGVKAETKFERATRTFRYFIRNSLKKFSRDLSFRISALSFDYKNTNFDDPMVGFKLPYPTNWGRIYPHKSVVVEIGSGHGEMLIHKAGKKGAEDTIFIGFEIASKFARLSAKRLESFKNAFVFKAEAYEKLFKVFKKREINELYILFPDPWHKKRHHKRRPLTKEFFQAVRSLLAKDGKIFFATDWQEYYGFVEEQIKDLGSIYKIEKGVYAPENFDLPPTHYYKKWVKLGREFRYIEMKKI